MIQALKDTEPSVKDEALAALNCFISFKHATPFINALGDTDVCVRKVAIKALGKARDKAAIEQLIHALEDDDRDICEAAQLALARIGAGAVKPLKQAMNDDSDVIRRGAARSLELMSKAKAKKRIERSQKHQSPEIWAEIEAAISAYSRERQANLASFNI